MNRKIVAMMAGAMFCAAIVGSCPAGADSANPATGFTGYSPRVPVSSLAPSMFSFDPSRLHLSTTVSVGTGFGGRAEGLQVTRLSYQMGAPLSLGVSVGSTLMSPVAGNGNSFFLEGLDLAYRPSPNMLFQIHYQDVRSPLQYRSGPFGAVPSEYWAR